MEPKTEDTETKTEAPVKKKVAKKSASKKAAKATTKTTTSKKAATKKPAKKASTKKVAAKKSAKAMPRGRQAGINKAEYVRARSKLSTKELIEAAKKDGFTLSANYIYVIRGKAAKPASKATRGPGLAKTNGTSNDHVSGDSMLFMNGVAESILNEDFIQQVAKKVADLLVGE